MSKKILFILFFLLGLLLLYLTILVERQFLLFSSCP